MTDRAGTRSLDPAAMSREAVYRCLAGGIGPRPIALVATVSASGRPNLAPYSFYNLFGIDPPVVGFAILQRMRDGSHKDSYGNLVAAGECTVQAVPHALLGAQSIAAAEFAPGVDEIAEAGLTPLAADLVRPPLIAESPFRLECRLMEMVALGAGPGAGHLAICAVLRIHLDEWILDGDGIDPHRIDLMGRLGGDDYVRASGAAVTALPVPSGPARPGRLQPAR